MSAGSISSGSSLANWFQSLQSSQSAGSSSTAGSSSVAASGLARSHGGHGKRLGAKIDSALTQQGVTGSDLSTLRTKIEDAISQAKASGSNDPGSIKSAVDGVLKDAGLNTDEFDAALAPDGGPGGPPPSDGSTVSSGDLSLSSSSLNSSGLSTSDLDSLLTKAGIDPSTFKSSLDSLLANGNTDSSSIGSLFSNASTGSDVDVYG